ncbi:right-handed parallel beta-helix repeat-containing protein [Haloferax sp. DFSO52]|uniref:right-handed parallel beta-helix repeat-containing protein n=1 Tax=Haloferax sp. DFSO52 TaxID=3388505 RepID=UPI003A8680F7
MDDRINRRDLVRSGTVASVAALAGCSSLRPDTEERESETRTDGGTTTDAQTPEEQTDGRSPSEFHTPLGTRLADRFVESHDDDPLVLDAEAALEEPGELVFGTATYTTDQLQTPDRVDYNDNSYYFRGAGVRNTALVKQPTDGDFIRFDDGREDEFGNFGGVSKMAVYGGKNSHERASKGNLIHSTGLIIDLLFENLIVRYGYDDGIHVERSADGVRLHNSWVENNDGWGIVFDGGTRAKVSNLHIIQNGDGGFRLNTDWSQVTGLSLYQNTPGLEVRSESCSVSNVYNKESGLGVHERGNATNNNYSNLAFQRVETGILTDGHASTWNNVAAQDTDTVMHIRGNRHVVTGVNARDSTLHVGSNATENVLSNVVADVEDRGVRTVVNGQATNDGDPRDGGEWHGHAPFAHTVNALVWDTSTSPRTGFRADGQGTWHPVG